ncbi:Hypothetical predicted protein, partial [Paramuricea clavata]
MYVSSSCETILLIDSGLFAQVSLINTLGVIIQEMLDSYIQSIGYIQSGRIDKYPSNSSM